MVRRFVKEAFDKVNTYKTYGYDRRQTIVLLHGDLHRLNLTLREVG